jgi:dihydrofolate reductase
VEVFFARSAKNTLLLLTTAIAKEPIRTYPKKFGQTGRKNVGKVILELSMSLDGFIAGPDDGIDLPLGKGGERLFAWYSSGDTSYIVPSGEMTFQVSSASAKLLDQGVRSVGALITGRRTFEITHAWGGRHPLDVPMVVLTHSVPQEWAKPGSPFTFVTDGIDSAVRQAKAIAGDKNVAVGTASTAQQCLKAGLLDEIQVDLAPVLLGGGVRLFDCLGPDPIDLEIIRVVEGKGVTHISYRVVK